MYELVKFIASDHGMNTRKYPHSSRGMDILSEAKRCVDADKLESLKEIWAEVSDCDEDWVSLFQKIYIHACLKGRDQIADWMQTTIFPQLDPIQQIAVRQTFAYGNHLLKRAKK